MSQFRRRLLMMMQKVQEIWRDVVLTGTGVIVATDTTEGQKVKIFPQGWTKQDQYEGKNLFDISKYVSDIQSVNNGDGSITLIEYAPKRTNKVKDAMPMLNVGDIVYVSAVNLKYVYFDILYVVNKPITITEEILNGNFGFYGNNSGESITIRDIMISKTKDLPYEPYTGNKPSPSPEYPQPITNAGTYNEEIGKWEYQLNVLSGNYFDTDKIPDKTVGQSYILNNNDGSITVKTTGYVEAGTISDFVVGIIPNRQYIIDAETTGDKPYFAIKTTATARVYYGEKIVFTEEIINGLLYVYGDSSGEPCVIKNISVRETSVTDYFPYQLPQTITLTSDRPLTQWDRLVYMDGKWQWEYNSEKVTFTENDPWSLPTGIVDGFSSYGLTAQKAKTDFLCENFICKPLKIYSSFKENVITSYPPNGDQIIILVENAIADSKNQTDLSEWLSWIKENPITILNRAITPEYIPLQESEQQALNSLKTYYPTTVFSNDQEGFMQVEYRTKYGGDA